MLLTLQLVMVCSWFFMPPDANIIKGAKFVPADPNDALSPSLEVIRRFCDGRMALVFYLTTALSWYATRIGLLQFGGPRCARPSQLCRNFIEYPVILCCVHVMLGALQRGRPEHGHWSSQHKLHH